MVNYRVPLSLPARSYLACMFILFLMALALHFSLQRQSSDSADQLLQSLVNQHGWSLGSARLHMLRGVLTLHDLSLHENGWEFSADHVLLRGHFSERLSEVRLSEWHIQRGRLQLSWDGEFFQPPSPEALPKLWREVFSSLHSMTVDEVNVLIHSSENSKRQPWSFARTHIQWLADGEGGRWFASSQGKGGLWQWRMNDGVSRLDWQGVDAQRALAFWGLSLPQGEGGGNMKGHALWQQGKLSGETRWQRANKEVSSLAWQGQQKQSNDIQLTVHSLNWPLYAVPVATLSSQCQWQQGKMNGVWHIDRRDDQSFWHSDELELSNLLAKNGEQTCWQAERLRLQGVDIDRNALTLKIEHFFAEKGMWSARQRSEPLPWTSIETQGSFSQWQLQLMPQLLTMQDLYGDISWQGQNWHLQATSMPITTVASNAEHISRWQLEASGHLSNKDTLHYSLQGHSIPLGQLRELLPTRIRESAELSGQVQLQWQGGATRTDDDLGQLSWFGQGDAVLSHVDWQRDGWQANCFQLDLDRIHYEHGRWHIGRIGLSPWQLFAPIAPLSSELPEVEEQQPFWLQSWSVDRLELDRGRFSIGWETSVWAKLDPITVTTVNDGSPLAIQLHGSLLDGDFQALLKWLPWQSPQKLEASVSLQHALPFTANAWLLQSDLPDFIRGRLSMQMELHSSVQDPYAYHGHWKIKLRHAALAQGVQQSKNFQRLTGVTPRQLLEGLSYQDMLRLDIPLQGGWQQDAPGWSYLARQLLLHMQQRSAALDATSTEPSVHARRTLAYVRLHRDDQLWPNERARIREVIKTLRRQPHGVVELVPQLGRRDLDATTIANIRYTQTLIENYIHAAGIDRQRVLPLWPQRSHQAGGEAGVRMQMYNAHVQ